jgi:glutathione S-transferase
MWAGWAGVNIDEFPNAKKWEEMMSVRKGVSEGSNVPKKLKIKEKMKDPDWQETYGKAASEWIMKGMADDMK